MIKSFLALVAILAVCVRADASTGTTSAATINEVRIVQATASEYIVEFTLTGITSAGTCPTAALDGTNTLVVWQLNIPGGSSSLTQNQLGQISNYGTLLSTIKVAQLNGGTLEVNWDDSKVIGPNSYCDPQWVQ